jgi:hypothetical protein
VDDMGYSRELLSNLRAQEAVGVRYDANREHCASLFPVRP